MNDEILKKIGKWLNSQGCGIDLSDSLWMEDFIWDEHKTRDIIELIYNYSIKEAE